jgi:hypothetical protein
VGLEPTTAVFEWAKTVYSSDNVVTVIGGKELIGALYHFGVLSMFQRTLHLSKVLLKSLTLKKEASKFSETFESKQHSIPKPRMRWLGHVERMPKEREIKKTYK